MLSKAERDHWQGLLATDYGIIADLYRLDGEFDLNVAIEVKGDCLLYTSPSPRD